MNIKEFKTSKTSPLPSKSLAGLPSLRSLQKIIAKIIFLKNKLQKL